MQPNSATEHLDRIDRAVNLALSLLPDSACLPALESLTALRATFERLERNSYPHMCRDEHEQIGYSNSEIELCPLCLAGNQATFLREQIAEMELRPCQHDEAAISAMAEDYQEKIAALTAEMEHYRDQRRRAHALIDKIMEAVESADIGERASEWDVLDGSVRQIVAERAALIVERDQALADVRGLQIGGDYAVQQIERLIAERDQARESLLGGAGFRIMGVVESENDRLRERVATLEAVIAFIWHEDEFDVAEKMAVLSVMPDIEARAALSPEAPPASGHWLIYYEDAEMHPEIFTDEVAARKVFEARSVNWSCHLFRAAMGSTAAPCVHGNVLESCEQCLLNLSNPRPNPSPGMQQIAPPRQVECWKCGKVTRSDADHCQHCEVIINDADCECAPQSASPSDVQGEQPNSGEELPSTARVRSSDQRPREQTVYEGLLFETLPLRCVATAHTYTCPGPWCPCNSCSAGRTR